MAFFEHGSFSDANGRFYSNVPVSGAHDNGGTAVNITPAKAVGSFNIPLFGVFSSKKYSDVIEYNRYLSTLSSAPYLGLDNITPILLPLGSNKKLSVKFHESIPIRELLLAHNSKGNSFTGSLYKQYIIDHTTSSMFRKLSREDEYVLDGDTWDYLRISNGKLIGGRSSIAPEFINAGQVQCSNNQGLFGRQGGKNNLRNSLANFKYYGSWYLNNIYKEDESKLIKHTSTMLGKRVSKVTSFVAKKLSVNDQLFWEILLSRVIGSKYSGSGLTFPFRLKGETKDRLFTINIETQSFIDEDNKTYSGLESDEYILAFNIDSYLNTSIWDLIKEEASTIVENVKNKKYSNTHVTIKDKEYELYYDDKPFDLDTYSIIDESKYEYKSFEVNDPNALVNDDPIPQITIGGQYYEGKLEPLGFDGDSTDQQDPYIAIPIINSKGDLVKSSNLGNEEYIHNSYLNNTSSDLDDKGNPINTKENTLLELPYANKKVSKIPDDTNNLLSLEKFEINSDLPETQIGNYIKYPQFEDFHLLEYTPSSTDDLYIVNTENREISISNNISTIKVTPMFMCKNLSIKVKNQQQITISNILSEDDFEENTNSETNEPQGETTLNIEELTFSPFLYLYEDFKIKKLEPDPNQPDSEEKEIAEYEVFRKTKNYSFKFNKYALDLAEMFRQESEIVLVTYIDEFGIERKDYIMYDSSLLTNDTPISYFIKQTHSYKRGIVRHIPFAPIWFQDSPISQETHSYIEVLIIFIPLPPVIIPIPIPRKGKALYARPIKDGFYHTGDKWLNLFLRKNQFRIDYYDRFEDPNFKQTFRDNYKVDNTKRTPRVFADRSFTNYIERPFTCKCPSGSAGNWTHTPYPFNKKNNPQNPTSNESAAKNSLNFGESYHAYYNQSNPNHLTKAYLIRKFSLTYMLNNDLRETIQLCKMAYQYISYLCKLNGISYSKSFSNVMVYSPSRIAFKAFRKVLRIRREILPSIESDLMSRSYDAIFDGDILKIRSKTKKEIVYLDFESYIPSYKSIYGVGLSSNESIKWNTSEIRTQLSTLWNTYYNQFTYPSNAIKQTTFPNNSVVEIYTKYLKELPYLDLVNMYNTVLGMNIKPNELNGSDNILELTSEYSKYNNDNIILDETGTKGTSYSLMLTKSAVGDVGIYSKTNLCYWYNKYYVKNFNSLGFYFDTKLLDGSTSELDIPRSKMEDDLLKKIIELVGVTPFICKEKDYSNILNSKSNIANYLNTLSGSTYHWVRVFSENTFIVPDDIFDLNSSNSSSTRFAKIVEIDSRIVDPDRGITVSSPFLPLFEDFYKKLSYTNKHFIHRTSYNMDCLSGIVIPVKYKNGSRWSFAISLIGVVSSIITIVATAGAAWYVVIPQYINLAAQLVTIYAKFFAKGSLQAKLLKLAGALGIIAAIISMYGFASGFEFKSFFELPTFDKINVISSAANSVLSVVNYMTNIILEAKLKKQQEAIDRAKVEGEALENKLDKTNDEYINMGMTTYVGVDVQSQLDYLSNKNDLVDLDRLSNISFELLYNYDNEFEMYYS